MIHESAHGEELSLGINSGLRPAVQRVDGGDIVGGVFCNQIAELQQRTNILCHQIGRDAEHQIRYFTGGNINVERLVIVICRNPGGMDGGSRSVFPSGKQLLISDWKCIGRQRIVQRQCGCSLQWIGNRRGRRLEYIVLHFCGI